MAERPVAPGGDRRRWLVGLVVIVALGAFGANAFKSSLATYTHDYAQVRSRAGVLLQVPGVVDKTVPQRYDNAGGTFEFTMLDVVKQTDQLPVRSHSVKPANFDTATQVVCVGTWKNGAFEADRILVKCPSKELDKQRQAGSPPAGS